jgi:hypothetical protein
MEQELHLCPDRRLFRHQDRRRAALCRRSPGPGLTPDQMRALQEKLDALGHDVGKIDGILGAGTRAMLCRRNRSAWACPPMAGRRRAFWTRCDGKLGPCQRRSRPRQGQGAGLRAAHHLAIGAAQSPGAVFRRSVDAGPVTVLARHRQGHGPCAATTTYWTEGDKTRPAERHQARQTRNAQAIATRRATTDWLVPHRRRRIPLAHPAPVWPISWTRRPPDLLALKFEPFEAMHDPMLPDDIFTARDVPRAAEVPPRPPARGGAWLLRRPSARGPPVAHQRQVVLSHRHSRPVAPPARRLPEQGAAGRPALRPPPATAAFPRPGPRGAGWRRCRSG